MGGRGATASSLRRAPERSLSRRGGGFVEREREVGGDTASPVRKNGRGPDTLGSLGRPKTTGIGVGTKSEKQDHNFCWRTIDAFTVG